MLLYSAGSNHGDVKAEPNEAHVRPLAVPIGDVGDQQGEALRDAIEQLRNVRFTCVVAYI